MSWYKKQNIHLKINIKGFVCEMVTGIQFADLTKFLNQKEIINLIVDKLIKEGFQIER